MTTAWIYLLKNGFLRQLAPPWRTTAPLALRRWGNMAVFFLPDQQTPANPSEAGRHWNPATALWACCRYRSVIRHLRSCTAEKEKKEALLCPNDSKSLRLVWQPQSTSAVFVLQLYFPNLAEWRQARLEHIIPAWCEVATMWLCSPAYAAWSKMFVASTELAEEATNLWNVWWFSQLCSHPAVFVETLR